MGTSEEVIYSTYTELLTDKEAYDAIAHAVNPYGDGHACEKMQIFWKVRSIRRGSREKE